MDGFGNGTKGFSSHKQHQYILFPLESRRLGITFVFASHSGGGQNGFQNGFSYNPELIIPDEAFLLTQRKSNDKKTSRQKSSKL